MQPKLSCNNCGYHMRKTNPTLWVCDSCCNTYDEEKALEEELKTLPTITTELPNSPLDSITPEQMRAVDRAMRRYFGLQLFVPEGVVLNEMSEDVLEVTGVLFNGDWREARKKEFPGL